jgi:hypothetical protein
MEPQNRGWFLDLEPNGYHEKWTSEVGWFLKTGNLAKWFLGVEPHGYHEKRRFQQKVVPPMRNYLQLTNNTKETHFYQPTLNI